MDIQKLKKLAEIYHAISSGPKVGEKISVEILDVSAFDDTRCYTIKIGHPFNTNRKMHFLG